MSTTIYLKNGGSEVVGNEKDFYRLIFDNLGLDAENYLRDLILNKGENLREIKSDLEIISYKSCELEIELKKLGVKDKKIRKLIERIIDLCN